MRWLIASCLALAACDGGPEVPTATENQDLDEAGRMLDEAPDNLSAIDANAVRPVAGTEPEM
jgi:hypothetical protein